MLDDALYNKYIIGIACVEPPVAPPETKLSNNFTILNPPMIGGSIIYR
jgi:hypothetical protein